MITCIKRTSALSGEAVPLEGDGVWVCARSEEPLSSRVKRWLWKIRLGLTGSLGMAVGWAGPE